MNIFVTGGAGFIGSNFLNLQVAYHPQHTFVNIDKLTYAANLQNLTQISTLSNYRFEQACLTDFATINTLFERYKPDVIFHFAAESHVDRSIHGPSDFIQSNIIGTFNLLEACRTHWLNNINSNSPLRGEVQGEVAGFGLRPKLFLHVSTDEVYGSLGAEGLFTENTPYDPSSPYSASKASSDHLVRAYHRTYSLPAIITNCSNNYGPYQFPEKLIPLMIINALAGKPLPVYGKGENVRDWLYVEDHCRALWTAAFNGTPGETYNIGGNNEWKNIDIVHAICSALAAETGRPSAGFTDLIKFVPDRPGHDLRYAIDSSKIKRDLYWQPQENFASGLQKTVNWYFSNPDWIEQVQSGAYRTWLEQNYTNR